LNIHDCNQRIIKNIIKYETCIAGTKTVKEWKELENKINIDFTNSTLWLEAFGFFECRIRTRYIIPAETISKNCNSRFLGEGFAITAIICTLIEAFESFIQGKNYKYRIKGEKLGDYEYCRSSTIFVDFLTKREPFKKHFTNRSLALYFYKNVRCSLLHEERGQICC
jgi:hypothetical protein